MSIYSASAAAAAAASISTSAPAALPPFLRAEDPSYEVFLKRHYVCPKAPTLHGLPEDEETRTSPLELEGGMKFTAEGKYKEPEVVQEVNRWIASVQFPEDRQRVTRIFFEVVGIFHNPRASGGAGTLDESYKHSLSFSLTDDKPFVIKPSGSFLLEVQRKADTSSGYLVTLTASAYCGDTLFADRTWVSTFSEGASGRLPADTERTRGSTF